MFKLSIKQLLRTPFKALLFVLLLAAATMLLVLGATLLVQSDQKISAAESQFKTIGSIAQKPDSSEDRVVKFPDDPNRLTVADGTYNQLLTPDYLDFEGADYVRKPDTSVVYMSYLPELNGSWVHYATHPGGIMEFSPLEDTDGSEESVMVHISKVHLVHHKWGNIDDYNVPVTDIPDSGNVDIEVYNHYVDNMPPMSKDKTYIAAIELETCENHIEGIGSNVNLEYTFWLAPFSTQCDKDGLAIDGNGAVQNMTPSVQNEDGSITIMKGTTTLNRYRRYIIAKTMAVPEEVTPGFFDKGGRGELWMNLVNEMLEERHTFATLAINSMEALPSKHSKKMISFDGRDITDEEFAQGANVCVVSKDFAQHNKLYVGDKLPLKLKYALYNYTRSSSNYILGGEYLNMIGGYSTLDTNGQPFKPFWEDEYEIVGIYNHLDGEGQANIDCELSKDTIIIPKASVRASDENNIAYYGPMDAKFNTFEIANGTIDEFSQKLYAAVPGALELDIKFDDSGYSQVRQSLDKARLNAVLLFAAGLGASIAIVALLLYFFVIKEKKRTAIERSLGVSRRQCRVSIISGLMVLAVVGTALGSAGGALLLHWDDIHPKEKETVTVHTVFGDEEAPSYAGFDVRYSQWAKAEASEDDIQLDGSARAAQMTLLAAAPLVMLALIWLLGVALVNRNMDVEPILLLSTRGDQ